MSRKNDLSKTKRRGKGVLPTGVLGLSFAIAGVACAESGSANAAVAPTSAQNLNLHEEEIADISLGSFYVMDKENPGGLRAGETRVAGWHCRCGGCRHCRCGGCRWCRCRWC
jgi:hypothetical protein